MYDSDGTRSAVAGDWPAIAAQGINTLVLPAKWISNLRTIAAAGDKAWVTAGHWSDSTESFSLSQSKAVSDVAAACATGAVQGIYVAGEPDETLASIPAADIAAIKARATALKAACPSAQTIMAYYDAYSLFRWAGVTDAVALDIYPSRDGFNDGLITQLAAAANAAGIKYYGVVGAFTDGASYVLPTAAQLSEMFATWQATNELGWVVYSWGATGGATSTQLQNQPSLLAVIHAEAMQ
jgi:hypothetical protein